MFKYSDWKMAARWLRLLSTSILRKSANVTYRYVIMLMHFWKCIYLHSLLTYYEWPWLWRSVWCACEQVYQTPLVRQWLSFIVLVAKTCTIPSHRDIITQTAPTLAQVFPTCYLWCTQNTDPRSLPTTLLPSKNVYILNIVCVCINPFLHEF